MSLQRKGIQRQISRSLSVPVNNKERSIKRMDSFFRMIPSTPQVKEGDTITNASPSVDAGMLPLFIFYDGLVLVLVLLGIEYLCI